MTGRSIVEIWQGRDKGRHYFRVSDADSNGRAADEHEAVVAVDIDHNRATCYRCNVTADITFKCVHVHEVRKVLDT